MKLFYIFLFSDSVQFYVNRAYVEYDRPVAYQYEYGNMQN